LRQYIIPQIRQGGVSVWVGGLASRAGDEAFNSNLASARAQNVARRIDFLAGQNYRSVVTSFGEGESRHGTENSAYYRSVLVVVARVPRWEPPPRPPREPVLSFFHKFKICLTWGFEGGEILAVGRYRFLIDYDESDPHAPPPNETRYVFTGGGFGGGAPAASSGGMVWNRFTLQANATPRDFEGRARMGGASLSFVRGIGYGTLRLIPERLPEVYLPDFQTGQSVSIGASIITGPFAIEA
jgi:hypothetical protein